MSGHWRTEFQKPRVLGPVTAQKRTSHPGQQLPDAGRWYPTAPPNPDIPPLETMFAPPLLGPAVGRPAGTAPAATTVDAASQPAEAEVSANQAKPKLSLKAGTPVPKFKGGRKVSPPSKRESPKF